MQGTRKFAQSLDRKYAPPSPELTIQIIQIIQELIEEEQKALFAELRLTTGGTFLGECSDMMSKMGVSFVTLNGSVMIEDPKEGFRGGGPSWGRGGRARRRRGSTAAAEEEAGSTSVV